MKRLGAVVMLLAGCMATTFQPYKPATVQTLDEDASYKNIAVVMAEEGIELHRCDDASRVCTTQWEMADNNTDNVQFRTRWTFSVVNGYVRVAYQTHQRTKEVLLGALGSWSEWENISQSYPPEVAARSKRLAQLIVHGPQ